jgi:hypothetical protein
MIIAVGSNVISYISCCFKLGKDVKLSETELFKLRTVKSALSRRCTRNALSHQILSVQSVEEGVLKYSTSLF